MKNQEVSRKLLRAISIGLAATMTLTPTATVFAGDDTSVEDSSSSDSDISDNSSDNSSSDSDSSDNSSDNSSSDSDSSDNSSDNSSSDSDSSDSNSDSDSSSSDNGSSDSNEADSGSSDTSGSDNGDLSDNSSDNTAGSDVDNGSNSDIASDIDGDTTGEGQDGVATDSGFATTDMPAESKVNVDGGFVAAGAALFDGITEAANPVDEAVKAVEDAYNTAITNDGDVSAASDIVYNSDVSAQEAKDGAQKKKSTTESDLAELEKEGGALDILRSAVEDAKISASAIISTNQEESAIQESALHIMFSFFSPGCNRCEQQGNNFYVSSRIPLI